MTILNETILPGESKTIDMEIARLHNMTKLKIPIIINRSKKPGPTVLFCAGMHGDEINGVEIVRQLIVQKINRPNIGTIICIPVVNIFGFVNQKREFPDGRDLNRVFPGSKTGSLASRFAYHLLTEILPQIDFVVDFHAGGASRFNASQIRIISEDSELKKLATIFHAPFVLYSKNIVGSFRNACQKRGVKILLFEGGKSLDLNPEITQIGVEGSKRFLKSLNMLFPKTNLTDVGEPIVFIQNSTWIRAKSSGMFIGFVAVGAFVKKGQSLATISDPYGKMQQTIKAPISGYLINVNHAPIVFQGDAIFHISTHLETE
uniref:succinylglutamate desuccinylase/aspartoacylase family protein n=1 Tax=Flavobacterium sp. TaxID=239 RepID=UPI00404A7935